MHSPLLLFAVGSYAQKRKDSVIVNLTSVKQWKAKVCYGTFSYRFDRFLRGAFHSFERAYEIFQDKRIFTDFEWIFL